MQDVRSKRKPVRWSFWIALAVLSALTLGLAIPIGHGLVSKTPLFVLNGWVADEWVRLDSPGRATLLGQTLFVFGAAWAAFLAPLLFGGELQNVRDASDIAIADLKLEIQKITGEISQAAEESRASMSVIQSYAITQMGFDVAYTPEHLPRAHQIISEMIIAASALCQKIVQAKADDNAFRGKWPGYKPFTDLMLSRRLIDDSDYERLMRLWDARRFTREQDPEIVQLPHLQMLSSELKILREKYRATLT